MMSRPDSIDPRAALQARMFDQRVVLCDGELDDETAARLAAEIMTLDAIGDERIQLLLNASGGSLEAAFTVIDVVDLCGVPVDVNCVGRADGPALGVLAAGRHRTCAPHARLRFGEPDDAFAGRADDVVRWAEHRRHQRERFCDRVARSLHRPAEWVADRIDERAYLDPTEAVRVGLVDEIARSTAASVHRFPGTRLGFSPPPHDNR
jgi:ATP-dependent Clp protease protease subunit